MTLEGDEITLRGLRDDFKGAVRRGDVEGAIRRCGQLDDVKGTAGRR